MEAGLSRSIFPIPGKASSVTAFGCAPLPLLSLRDISPWQGEGPRFYAYDTNLKEVVSSMKKLFCIAAALALLAVLALRFCSKGRESWET